MSLVAGRTVTPLRRMCRTRRRWRKVTAGSFWPEIALSDVRMEMRINGAVTTSRLKQAVIEGVSHTLDQLADWQAVQLAAGYTQLDDVPAVKLTAKA